MKSVKRFSSILMESRGLGLSSCYYIIQQHEGFIDVDTREGRGSVFSVLLPSIGYIISKEDIPASRRDNLAGHGRIMLLDDEDIIRRSTGRILKRLEYEVEMASRGEEILSLFDKSREEGMHFDAIILDLAIPGGLGGREKDQKLREKGCTSLVIASSGYSNEPVLAEFEKYGFNDIILKPYTVELLAGLLMRLLVQ